MASRRPYGEQSSGENLMPPAQNSPYRPAWGVEVGRRFNRFKDLALERLPLGAMTRNG